MMKVKFTASFGDYFVKLLIWIGVSIITLGIGSIWVGYDWLKWTIEHIEIEK